MDGGRARPVSEQNSDVFSSSGFLKATRGKAQTLHPAKSHTAGHEVDTSLWLKSPQQQNDRVLKVRTGPSPYTLSPSAKADRNLEVRLTSSNNLFPSGSTFESSRNASSPTKQISCPSYTKREKKFGRETPQKKTLGQPVPFLGDTYRVSQNNHLHSCLPWSVQTHQRSQNLLVLPFHQVFYVWQLEENKKAQWARGATPRWGRGPWQPWRTLRSTRENPGTTCLISIISAALETTAELHVKATTSMNLEQGGPGFLALGSR